MSKCTDPNKPYCIGPKKKDKNITNCYGEPYNVEKEFKELFNPTPNNPTNPDYLKATDPSSNCVGLDSAIITNAAEADRQLQTVFQNPSYNTAVSKYTDLLKSAQPDDVDKIIKMLTTQLKNSKPFLINALNDDTMINYIKKVVETLKIKWDTVSNSGTKAAILVGKLEEQVNQYETNKPNMSTEIGKMIDAKVASINSAEFKTGLANELVELKKQPNILKELIDETQKEIRSSLQGIIKIGLFTMLRADQITEHTVGQLFPTKQIGGASPWLDKLKNSVVRKIVGSVVGLPFLVSGLVVGAGLTVGLGVLGVVGAIIVSPIDNDENDLGTGLFKGGIFTGLAVMYLGIKTFDFLSDLDIEGRVEKLLSGGKSLRRRHKKTRKGSRRRSKARRSTLVARRKRARKSRRRRYEKYV